MKSSPEGVYAFDFGQQGKGIRTSAPDHTVSPTGIDPFSRVTSEVINGSLVKTTYDKQGQIQQRDQAIFHWDAFGRLTGIDEEDYTWRAFYDALGRRLQTFYQTGNNSVCTQSFYDPDHEFREIGVKIEDKTFWKIYGEEKCEAVMDEEGHLCELMHDALGNLVGVISSEEICWIKDFPSSYGVIKDSNSEANDLLSFAQSLAWQSFYQDPTGLIWMGARYYDPRAGRFLSSDPIGYPLGLDLYGYANGDPVNYRDPDGRFFSAAYQKMGAVVINTLNNPRFQGSVQAFGGLVEAGVGAGMTYTTGGFAAPLGWPVMAHGLDHFITGVSTAISGRSRDTLTAHLLQSTGVSAETSRSIDNGMGFFGTLGGTASLVKKAYSALDGLKFPYGFVFTENIILENNYVNLASKDRSFHILFGDTTGGGHLYPGMKGKSFFPKSWDSNMIMHHISDIVTDPKIQWQQISGKIGAKTTKSGLPVRYQVVGTREGVTLKVIVEPEGKGIITGYPLQ